MSERSRSPIVCLQLIRHSSIPLVALNQGSTPETRDEDIKYRLRTTNADDDGDNKDVDEDDNDDDNIIIIF